MYIRLKYKMNFKPKIKNYSKLNQKLQNKLICCKNFIFIVILFEIINYGFKNNKFKFTYYILKKKNSIGSILRAPYKNKSSQFKLKLLRYYIILNIKINIKINIKLSSFLEFFKLINNIFKSFSYFESTLITQNNKLISIPLSINLNLNEKNIN